MITGTELITLVFALATIARIIVKLTPTKKDDNVFIKVMKVLESLGLPDVKGKK